MYLRIFGKIKLKSGLFFLLKYYKSISLKLFIFLLKATYRCCQSSLQIRYVTIAIKYVMIWQWQSRDRQPTPYWPAPAV